MERETIIDFSQIAYFLWFVYFFVVLRFGTIYGMLPTLLGYLMVLVMLVYRAISNRGYLEIPIHYNSLIVWYGLFFLWECLAGFWTPAYIAFGNTTISQKMKILSILFAMDIFVACKEDVEKLIKSFCTAATLFGAWAFVTSPVSSYGSLGYGNGAGQHRNTIGYVLCLATYFLVYLYQTTKKRYWLIFAVTCFVSSILTGSRKIIFAYILAVALVVLAQKNISTTIKYFVCILIAAAIIIPIIYQIPFIRATFGQRLLAVFDDSIDDSSVFFRNLAKENAFRIFKESPLIGNGWEAVKHSFVYKGVSLYAHNNYLEVAADYGLIGCFFYYYKSFYLGFRSFLNLRKNKACCTAAILLLSTLLLDWGQVTHIYLFMLFIWGIIYKFAEYMCFAKEEEQY